MTPFDLPLAHMGDILAGSFDSNAIRCILTLMKEAHPDNYTPSVGDGPFAATIRAVNAKFGVGNPVSRKIASIFQRMADQ